MAVKKTIRKITSKEVMKKIEPVEAEVAKESPPDARREVKKRGCTYCETRMVPSYTDTQTLKRFLSERGKILPKGYTKVCSKHQRAVTKQIKYARHLSLLPFTPKV
ncbi:MAG: 30S ribosomal protein S18 [Patescibacteria group bacterium]